MAKLAMKHIKQQQKDDASPVLVVEATLVKKHRVRKPATKISSSRIRFYATFEFENGGRQEFIIHNWDDYHSFVAGDVGKLTFQGTRYKKFDSVIMSNKANLKGIEAAKDFIRKVIDDNFGS